MPYKVRLMELPATHPVGVLPIPEEKPGFAIDADNHDLAAKAVRRRLVDWGHKVRSISALADGTADFIAVVYPAAKAETAKALPAKEKV